MSDRKNHRRTDRRCHRGRRIRPSTDATRPSTAITHTAGTVVFHVAFQRIT